MDEEKKIKVIPAHKRYKQTRVAIYCRVSTRSQEQVQSMANQMLERKYHE